MSSEEKLSHEVNMGHPWANSPQTVGSLTLMHLTIIFTYLDNDVSDYDESQMYIQS